MPSVGCDCTLKWKVLWKSVPVSWDKSIPVRICVVASNINLTPIPIRRLLGVHRISESRESVWWLARSYITAAATAWEAPPGSFTGRHHCCRRRGLYHRHLESVKTSLLSFRDLIKYQCARKAIPNHTVDCALMPFLSGTEKAGYGPTSSVSEHRPYIYL